MDILERENAVPAEVDTTGWSVEQIKDYLSNARNNGESIYITLEDGTELYSCDATDEAIEIAYQGVAKYTKKINIDQNKPEEPVVPEATESVVEGEEPVDDISSPEPKGEESLRDIQITTNKMAELIGKKIELRDLSDKYEALSREYKKLTEKIRETSESSER